MTISLDVLEHLGMKLYSNIPAVLSELVANAWDANATEVDINIDSNEKRITIKDNGIGMKRSDVINKYLVVGYKKRDDKEAGPITPEPLKRHVMGRKGIGKLSVFSIAKEVSIYTKTSDGELTAFKMNSDEIEKQKNNANIKYQPSEITINEDKVSAGTNIVLENLNKNVSTATPTYIKTRVSRRFKNIGFDSDFVVRVNGEEITIKDRDLYHKAEFMWYLGSDSKRFAAAATSILDEGHKIMIEPIRKVTYLIDDLREESREIKLSGWIGTVKEQADIDEETNRIILMAHGKLIDEDVLVNLKKAGIYAKYIFGEVEADFLDSDNQQDIVTSDRQRVRKDDERSKMLIKAVENIVDIIGNQWRDLRNDKGVTESIKDPAIKEWYDTLKGERKKYAKQLLGKLNQLQVDKEAKIQLHKSAIIGFEAYAHRNVLSSLDNVSPENLHAVLASAFESHDRLEEVYYYSISKGRVEVLKEFAKLFPTEKESVVQKYIKDHLWLINPAWERATEPLIESERSLVTILRQQADINNITRKVETHRIDLYYKQDTKEDTIIELKRANVKLSWKDLHDQGEKYSELFNKIYSQLFPDNSIPKIRIIFLIGDHPIEGKDKSKKMLAAAKMEYLLYDQMLQEAQKDYESYLKQASEVEKLVRIIDRIGR